FFHPVSRSLLMFHNARVLLSSLFLLSPDRGATHRRGRTGHGFTLVELLVVVAIIGLLVRLLLVGLSKVRKSALAMKLAKESALPAAEPPAPEKTSHAARSASARPPARVKAFAADIVLTPRLSVGTAEPESIYEAKFNGRVEAVQPGDS